MGFVRKKGRLIIKRDFDALRFEDALDLEIVFHVNPEVEIIDRGEDVVVVYAPLGISGSGGTVEEAMNSLLLHAVKEYKESTYEGEREILRSFIKLYTSFLPPDWKSRV
jgi:hypothetical protein